MQSGGRQGHQVVRVVPDFQGQWAGGLRVTSCTETGAWAAAEFCQSFPVGETDGYGLALTQTGESLTGRFNFGSGFSQPQAQAAIVDNGSATFTATFNSLTTPGTIESTWRISSPSRGTLAGTVSELWRIPGVSGEARLEEDIVQDDALLHDLHGVGRTVARHGARARVAVNTKGRLTAALQEERAT